MFSDGLEGRRLHVVSPAAQPVVALYMNDTTTNRFSSSRTNLTVHLHFILCKLSPPFKATLFITSVSSKGSVYQFDVEQISGFRHGHLCLWFNSFWITHTHTHAYSWWLWSVTWRWCVWQHLAWRCSSSTLTVVFVLQAAVPLEPQNKSHMYFTAKLFNNTITLTEGIMHIVNSSETKLDVGIKCTLLIKMIS